MIFFIHKKITYEYLEQLKPNQNLCISDSETPELRLRF